MDNWTDRIDRHIWDSLRGTVTTLRLDDRRQDQEFSCSLGVQMPVDEPSHHAADYHNLRLAELEQTVRAKLNGILEGSGPLKPILAQLLSTRGKFFRPRLVISSSYACLPYVLDKRRCPTCSRLYGQLRKGPGSEQWGRGAKAPGPASTMLPSHADFDDKMLDMITDIAAAFEMVHMASLVHDDIIDGSAHRRGKPALHLTWGTHSAVLAGDYLFAQANSTVVKHAGLGIAACLSDAVGLMCRGEVAQDSRFYDPDVTVGDYFYQTGRKTAALIAAACKAGAMAAKAPLLAQECLWRFGIKLGTAFQIIDDILDIVADGEALGKPVFSDLRRGILTLPLIYAMGTESRRDILECLSHKAVPDHRIPQLRSKLVSGGHVRQAGEVACKLLQSARLELSLLPDCPGTASLKSMCDGLVQRVWDVSLAEGITMGK